MWTGELVLNVTESWVVSGGFFCVCLRGCVWFYFTKNFLFYERDFSVWFTMIHTVNAWVLFQCLRYIFMKKIHNLYVADMFFSLSRDMTWQFVLGNLLSHWEKCPPWTGDNLPVKVCIYLHHTVFCLAFPSFPLLCSSPAALIWLITSL